MIRLIIFLILFSFAASCKKPYGQNPVVAESVPDTLTYPQITEIEDNDDPFQYYRLARIRYARGESAEAIEYAREAIALDDANALYYNLLATIMAKEGKSNEALENALKAYSLGYVNPDLQVLLAQLYYERGNISEGEKYLDVALRKRPNDPKMMFLRARTHLQQGDTLKAVDWINRSLRADTTYLAAYRQKAEIMIALDSIDQAIDQFKSIYNSEPQDLENIYALATLELERNNNIEARKWLFELINKDSTHNSAYLQLAQTYMDQRMYDSVRHFAGEALDNDENFNDARLLMARSFDRQYRYAQALEQYQEIVARDSTFDIAIIEMEILEKKIAYLRRMREQQDTIPKAAPSPSDTIN